MFSVDSISKTDKIINTKYAVDPYGVSAGSLFYSPLVCIFFKVVPVVAQPSQIHVDASQKDPGSFLGERLRAQLVHQRSPNRMQGTQ